MVLLKKLKNIKFFKNFKKILLRALYFFENSVDGIFLKWSKLVYMLNIVHFENLCV